MRVRRAVEARNAFGFLWSLLHSPLAAQAPSPRQSTNEARFSLDLRMYFPKRTNSSRPCGGGAPEAASAACRNGQPYSTQREASSSDANSRCRSVPMCRLAHVSGSTFVHFCRVLRRTLRRSWETSAVRFGNAAHRADPHGTCHLFLPLTSRPKRPASARSYSH